MKFLKAAWKFVVGVKDLLVLCFMLLFFGALYAALSYSSGERPMKTTSGALLVRLEGAIVEQPRMLDPASLLLGGEPPMREYAVRDVVAALDAAARDDNVKALVLDLDRFAGGGQVTLSRVGRALDGVRRGGKPVLAYATLYTDDGYQLASHASEIWVNPLGGVALTGRGGSNLYFKGLIDKLGVTTHIYRVGTYKSAVEPLMRADQSPEAKAASQAVADALWQDWLDEVARARPRAAVATYARDPVGMAEAARGDVANASLAARLVDRLGSRTAFQDRVLTLLGGDDDGNAGRDRDFAPIEFADYVRAHRPANDGEIGVLTVAGDIVDGDEGPGVAAGDSIVAQLDDALDKGRLKALVVRVDSPGGSVLASEQIRDAILRAKAQGLPVVTSMGNLAASGGYWVATASDSIIAEPDTITGSIGVFGVIPSFEGMLAKIGVTADGVRTTPLSGEPDVAGGISPEFNRIAQLSVEDIYRRFLGHVAQARRMTPARVDRIAQGRVWDGGTARQLGLVDGFGGVEEAVATAARLAKLDPEKARPFYIEPEADPFQRLLTDWAEDRSGGASGARDIAGMLAQRQIALLARAVGEARALASGGSIQARCLECGSYGAVATAPAADARAVPGGVLDRLIALLLG